MTRYFIAEADNRQFSKDEKPFGNGFYDAIDYAKAHHTAMYRHKVVNNEIVETTVYCKGGCMVDIDEVKPERICYFD